MQFYNSSTGQSLHFWQHTTFRPNRFRNWWDTIWIFHATMTLNEGQSHPNWYQNVEFSSLVITSTPNLGQGHWNWYKTVEVSAACKHGRYRHLVKKFACNVQAKFFLHKRDSWPDEHDWYHRSIWHILLIWIKTGHTNQHDMSDPQEGSKINNLLWRMTLVCCCTCTVQTADGKRKLCTIRAYHFLTSATVTRITQCLSPPLSHRRACAHTHMRVHTHSHTHTHILLLLAHSVSLTLTPLSLSLSQSHPHIHPPPKPPPLPKYKHTNIHTHTLFLTTLTPKHNQRCFSHSHKAEHTQWRNHKDEAIWRLYTHSNFTHTYSSRDQYEIMHAHGQQQLKWGPVSPEAVVCVQWRVTAHPFLTLSSLPFVGGHSGTATLWVVGNDYYHTSGSRQWLLLHFG